jgi:uncharacterized paraquat-inducible protein A
VNETAPYPPTVAPALTQEKGVATLAKKPAALRPFSPYAHGFLYCAACAAWVHISEAVFDRAGRPRCPRCGRVLRVRPRWYRGRG